MKSQSNSFVFVALLFGLFGSVLSEDWARFRGPDGAGQSEASGIPLTWASQDYKWRIRLPGSGHSSPVASGEQVFVMSAVEESNSLVLTGLQSRDGRLLWQARFPLVKSRLGRSTSYDTASPTVDEERVYLAWGSSQGYMVVAVNRQDGKEVWRSNLGPYQGDHGFGPSPIRFEDLVILANDQRGPSQAVALDRRTGEVRWTTERPSGPSAYSTPAIHRPENGPPQVIFSSTARGVSSLDPYTGALRWEVTDLFGRNRVVGSPVAAGGLIFAQAGLGNGSRKMFAIRPPDSNTGAAARVEYELEGSLPYVPTPVAHHGWLFLISDGGIASCIEIASGRRIWRERLGGNFSGSPIRVGDRIYLISKEGEVVVLAAAPEYELLGRIDLGEASYSTPAVAGGVMYLRTYSHLMAIGGK